MAVDETNSGTIIHPSVSRWNLKQMERDLFQSAEEVQNWKLADKSRRLLINMSFEMSGRVSDSVGNSIAELEAADARQLAVLALSNLTVRAAGSAIALVSCGYVPESGGSIRRCVEAGLRAEAVIADPSGQHARDWLVGRPRGSAERLAQKFGKSDDLKLLSMFAHADVRSLMPLVTGPQSENEAIDLRPNRTDAEAASLLHAVAHPTVMMCAALAEVFDVALDLNPWVASELSSYRKVVEELKKTFPDRMTRND